MLQFLLRVLFTAIIGAIPGTPEAYNSNKGLTGLHDSSKGRHQKPDPAFSYETIKVRYGLPSEITRALRRLFGNEVPDEQSVESTRAVSADPIPGPIQPLDPSDYYDKTSLLENSGAPSGPKSNYRSKRGAASAFSSASDSEVSKPLPGAKSDSSTVTNKDDTTRTGTIFWPDDRNSLILVRDSSGRIEAIKKIVASLDRSESQVRIESRIVRANRDWSRGMGILWGGRNNQFGGVKTDRSSYWGITGNQSGAPANTATGANLKQTIFVKGVQQPVSRTITSSEIPSRLAVNLPASVANIGDIMGLGLQFGLLANQYITELDFRLQIGEAQGQARTVARPSIQVSDGRNAVIKSGSVLNVQTTSPQWGTNSQLVSVDLKLQVNPKILPDGRIRMVISVTDNEPNPFPTTGELYLEREAHTTMTVANGETCVIGGIIRDTVIGRREGWPGLMNLPIIGMLFSNKSKAKEIDELLVFISPEVVFKPK